MTDNITKPKHYHKNGVDVIGFAEAQFDKKELKGFCRINALKYVTRYDRKNGIEDLKKAKFYINKLIELETPAEESKTISGDTFFSFMRTLSEISIKEIETYRGGTNPND